SLYIADPRAHRIRRVGPDGIITTVAGNGAYGYSCDGGPATKAQLPWPSKIDVGPDGSLYIMELDGCLDHGYIQPVSPECVITTIAGNRSASILGDDGPANAALLNVPQGIAIAPDGGLYVPTYRDNRIRRIDTKPLPGFLYNDIHIASDDGSEIYVFDSTGRH